MPARPATKRPATGAALFSTEVTASITNAVLDEMAQKGYAGMSMESVARAAAVSKSAIYRRWPSKEEMTVDVIGQLIVFDTVDIDTGTLHGDLREALSEMHRWLVDERVRRIYVDLLANGMRNPALATALTVHIGIPRRTRGDRILDRAIKRGELDSGIDRELALDLIGAPVFWRLVARREHMRESDLDRMAAALLAGVRAAMV